MKIFLTLLGLALALATTSPAQEALPTPPLPSRTPEQLDQLLGPIALYPDALIALILPASTAPSDIVLAARYLQAGNDPTGADDQPWDESVRSLAHYPEIVNWMDQNLAWTKQLGEAFVAQPAEVMQSVQRLRAAARAAGTLIDTPQQQVVYEGDAIAIVPGQPDVIYVPYYDPNVVYLPLSGFYNGPYLTFGVGFSAGSWLSFDFDWGNRRIWYVNRDERDRYWREHRDWRFRTFPGWPAYVRDPGRRTWTPPQHFVRPTQIDPRRPRVEIARPTPLPSAPAHPYARRSDSPTTLPDLRGRPSPADGRDRNRLNQTYRSNTAAPPATVPQAAIVQPPAPPPARVDPQRGHNEVRAPDQPGRVYPGRAVPRGSVATPPPANQTHPAPISRGAPPPSQTPPAAQPVYRGRSAPTVAPAPVAAPAPANQNAPTPPPDENKRPAGGRNSRVQPD